MSGGGPGGKPSRGRDDSSLVTTQRRRGVKGKREQKTNSRERERNREKHQRGKVGNRWEVRG